MCLLGHASFTIFTTCCYFKDESNAINKKAISVTSETSDHSRSVSVSCLQKVIHFVREKYTHLPLKLNVIVWSDGCAAQFRSRYVFFLLSNLKCQLTLAGSITSSIMGKVPWMGLVALSRMLCTMMLSQERIINDAKDLPSMPIKQSREFHPCICRVTTLSLSRRKSIQLQRFQKPLKSIISCAPWRKEKILCFSSIT